MGRAALALAAVATGALAAAGCPSVPARLERPRLEVGAVKLEAVAVAQVEPTRPLAPGTSASASPGASAPAGGDLALEVALTVSNPNPVPAHLRAADWELAIGKAAPRRGRTPLDATVPANGSLALQLPVRVPDGAAVEMTAELAAGTRAYRLSGAVHAETDRGDAAIWFDVAGGLDR
jgi:hypothetical protein